MANLVINGAIYEDVPSIEVPNEQGEMVSYVDTDTLLSVINRSVTELRSSRLTIIGAYSLMLCANLESIYAPNLARVDNYGLRYCSNLTILQGPELNTINTFAIANCSNLTELQSQKLTYIGNSSLAQCSSLTTLCLRNSSVCSIGHSNALISTPIASGTGYIYVPSALVDSYKSATNWSVYANQFRALEDYTVDGTITGELDESKI